MISPTVGSSPKRLSPTPIGLSFSLVTATSRVLLKSDDNAGVTSPVCSKCATKLGRFVENLGCPNVKLSLSADLITFKGKGVPFAI